MLALILSAAAIQTPVEPRHPAVDLFVSACIDGRVNLAPGTFRQMKRRDVPPVVRRWYTRQEGEWRYYEILHPERAILVVHPSGSPDDYYRNICAVGAPDWDVDEAFEQVWKHVWGRIPEGPPAWAGDTFRRQLTNYAEAYELSAQDRGSGWTILQVGHIGPGGRKKFEIKAREAQERWGRERDQQRTSGSE